LAQIPEILNALVLGEEFVQIQVQLVLGRAQKVTRLQQFIKDQRYWKCRYTDSRFRLLIRAVVYWSWQTMLGLLFRPVMGIALMEWL
jgi:hypothetical protein